VRLIDTAGMRKKAKVQDKLEKLAVTDGLRAVDFAEVVVLLLDATLGLEAQDLRIADRVLQEGRALDHRHQQVGRVGGRQQPVPGHTRRAGRGPGAGQGRAAAHRLGRDRQGAGPAARRRFRGARGLVAAGDHGRAQPLVRNRHRAQPAAAPGGKRIKLRYITQVSSRPPSFVPVRHAHRQLPESYRRYLVNGLRKE
jgi:GTP-binding protein